MNSKNNAKNIFIIKENKILKQLVIVIFSFI